MRMPRPIVNKNEYGNYHLVSRIVDSSFRLSDDEKTAFESKMSRLAGFCGINILTFSIMDNHFHILVRVPPLNCKVDEPVLIARYRILYGERRTKDLTKRWNTWKEQGFTKDVITEQENLRRRMHDISNFMKEMKQSFSKYYNKLHLRKGTLWEERFKSVVVEDEERALTATSAYIDLNPVRAGMEKDPRDYKWSGIGHAYKGKEDSLSGISYIMQIDDYEEALKKYCGLIARDGIVKRENKCVMDENVYEKLLSYSQIEYKEMSKFRIAAMTKGCFFGSKKFVEDMFLKFRNCFSKKRTTGARKIPCRINGAKLYTVREIRKKPIEILSDIS